MYSALKRNGKPLYDLARQGIEIEREARTVIIHELLLLNFAADRCRLRIICSKGTYIRTLADDLAIALGSAAHLTVLRRLAVGPLHVTDAVTLDQLAVLSEEERGNWLQAPDCLLQSLPAISLDDAASRSFVHGNPFSVTALAGQCRVYGLDRLLGIGEVDEAGCLKPRRVVAATVEAL